VLLWRPYSQDRAGPQAGQTEKMRIPQIFSQLVDDLVSTRRKGGRMRKTTLLAIVRA